MNFKPLPFEQPSNTCANTGDKLKPKKVSKHKKLNTRVRKHHESHREDQGEKILKDTCSKILSYLESKGKKSIKKISALEHSLHRSILRLQKEKRKLPKDQK